jgi:hypothetical protein
MVAAALLWSAAAAPAEPCRLQPVGLLDVTTDANGAVFVPVSLDGHEGLMALQLSNGLPAIFEGYVDSLGLRGRLQKSEWDANIGDKHIEKQVSIESTLLGRTNFTKWTFQVYPKGLNFRPSVAGLPVFGVMTSIFMNAIDLELNLAARRIVLFKPNKCRGTPVYWDATVTGVDLFVDRTGLMLFPMEVEGKRFEGSLNTTSRLSVISSEAARRYLGFDETSAGIEHEPLPGDAEVASFRAMSLTAKGLDVRNSRVRIKKMPKCSLSAADRSSNALGCTDVLGMTPFSIGTDLMRKLRIYVSVADHKIYFTRVDPADGPAVPAPVLPAVDPAGANAGQSAVQ